MKRTPYKFATVDVFTSTRFGGNPLAVIFDAIGLTGAQMQAVAFEFGYSETVFALPPSNSAHAARLRIFTPRNEIPFAGHPNVGAAFIIAQLGKPFAQREKDELTFEEGAGLVRAELLRREGEVVGARIDAPVALEIGPEISSSAVCECLSIEADGIVSTTHSPIRASVGLPFTLVELSPQALFSLRPVRTAFERAHARYPHPDDRFSIYAYCRESEGDRSHLIARMFAPLSDIEEDAATGSAAAALGALLATLDHHAELSEKFWIEQGALIGRPSEIEVDVVKHNRKVVRTTVAGKCVSVMQGVIEI